MAAEIPAAPEVLHLPVERHWDGTAVDGPTQRAWVTLCVRGDDLHVAAGMPHQRPPRVPDAPPGARVDGLWEFDVVECFLVGADGAYRELELDSRGHHLALAFAEPRALAEGVDAPRLETAWTRGATGWRSECVVPRAWLPEPVVAVNAFAIGGGAFLAHRPTGGDRPDFHRPATFPSVRIPSWEGR